MNSRPNHLLTTIRCLFGLLLALMPTLLHAEPPIRAAIGQSNGPPWVEWANTERRQIKGGLLNDLMELIAKELNRPLQRVPVARLRVEAAMNRGEVDLICNVSPSWNQFESSVQWLGSAFPVSEILVTSRRIKQPVEQLSDLTGKRLGLVHGYRYPALQALLQSKSVTELRETSQSSLMKLLSLDIADAVVITELLAAQYVHDHPEILTQITVSPIPISTTQAECAVSGNGRIDPQAAQQAMDRLRNRGELARLYASYRAGLDNLSPPQNQP